MRPLLKLSNLAYLLLSAIAIYIVIAISALSANLISYDEPVDYHAVTSHVWHALEALKLRSPDYRDIFSNTEFYGQAGRILGWLMYFLHRYLLFGGGGLESIVNTSLVDWNLTGYIFYSHLGNILIFLLGLFPVLRISRIWSNHASLVAGCLYISLPTLVGHSLFNTKDVPTAVVYTLFTWQLIIYAKSPSRSRLIYTSLLAALLINIKTIFAVPVFISFFAGYLIQSRSNISTNRVTYPSPATVILQLVLIVLAWFFLTPAAWLSPIGFVHESFNFFANFDEGGGCTEILSSIFCLGGSRMLTLIYILIWPLIHLPLLTLLGLIVFIWGIIRGSIFSPFRKPRKIELGMQSTSIASLMLLLQIVIVPFFAVLGGSNLYDADRQYLFIYPALCIFSALGLFSLFRLTPSKFKYRSLAALAVMFLSILINNLMLHPYQYIYSNEFARTFIRHTNTVQDYWAVSSREAVQQAILNSALPLQPDVYSPSGIIEPPPFGYAIRGMGGRPSSDQEKPALSFAFRTPKSLTSPTVKEYDRPCNLIYETKRAQLFFPPIVLSRLYRCDS